MRKFGPIKLGNTIATKSLAYDIETKHGDGIFGPVQKRRRSRHRAYDGEMGVAGGSDYGGLFGCRSAGCSP